MAVLTAPMIVGAACAGPPPKLFPVTPIVERTEADGRIVREYDQDGNKYAESAEVLDNAGRIVELRERSVSSRRSPSSNPDEKRVESGWTAIASRAASAESDSHLAPARRHLLIIVDSVPYDLVRELWDSGRFRMFHRPVQTIAPFPVMTDLSLCEFFGCSPCPGVESAYFDGRRLRNGYETYAGGGNVPWHRFMDYTMNTSAHAWAYLWPDAWFDHELRRIQETFLASDAPALNTYCVGTSAVGAKYGRDGHLRALIRLDRFCQWLNFHEHGNIDITLMSDHGHNLMHSRLIPLPEILARAGYRVTDRLERTGDVVLPEFGIVTCAALSTHEPARVARDTASVDGIRFAAYLDKEADEIVVVTRDGEARIRRNAQGQFRYSAARGDPLQLLPLLSGLNPARSTAAVASTNSVAAWFDDAAVRDATRSHAYVDPLNRLWRAFHGLVANPPDVLLDVADGWHCGSPFMSKVIDLAAAHGNLGPLSSHGFCMTTAGDLPMDLRMEELAAALEQAGEKAVRQPRRKGD